MARTADFIVIGGGIAGISVAYELLPHGSVAVLEQESATGYHSTGRSAAVMSENYGPRLWSRLVTATRGFLENPPEGFTDLPLVTDRGALFLAQAHARLAGALDELDPILGPLGERFADAVAHTTARICCTRKTVPGLRALEKYAVRCGGGANHRFGLDDAILIKDNHIALAGGRAETAHALYRQAIESTSPRSSQRQQVQWNYGWDLLRAGDAEGALTQWAGVMEGRRQQPEWLPPTLALALWRLDRRAEAVAWFAAAVRTHPDRWPYAANLPALLPDWREDERATLAQVQAAWVANPPVWP